MEAEGLSKFYRVVVWLERWRIGVISAINRRVPTTPGSLSSTSVPSGEKLNDKVQRAFSNYYTDVSNDVDIQEANIKLTNELSVNATNNLISPQDMNQLLNTQLPPTLDDPLPVLGVRNNGNITTLTLGDISMQLPSSRYQELLKSVTSEDRERIVRLMLSYHPLNPSGGFFWSIDPLVYKWLNNGSPNIIECYASPFNYNSRTWCSLFESDKAYGSKGNFKTFVRSLNSPYLLVANPPYTEKVVSQCISEVTAYIARVPNSGAILVLSVWNDMKELEELKAKYPNDYLEMKPNHYSLYNHLNGTSFSLNGVNLVLFSIGNPSPFVAVKNVATEVYNARIQRELERTLTTIQ